MTIILFITTIIVFLTANFILERKEARQKASIPEPAHVLRHSLRTPGGIFFARSHTWLNLFPSGKVRLGIDDFILRMLKHPEVQFLKTPGSHVEKGEALLRIEEGRHALTIRSPLAGEIDSCNHALSRNPELLNRELFNNGWAYTISPQKVSDLRPLLLGEESRSWIQGELARLRDFFAGVSVTPAYLQDGGTPVNGALTNLSDEQWKKFEQQFLITL